MLVGLQVAFVVAVLAFLGYALRDVWADAIPRLADADPVFLAAALAVLAAYYLLFAVGWWWLLAAFRIRVSYGIALQAEMASMLAKYVPGGIWTPLARIVWLRRAGGVDDTSFVVSSILLEAGLSAIAGILVFTAGLTAVDAVEAPLVPLFAFAAATAILLHPRVFTALARTIFRRFDAPEPPRLRYRILLGLLALLLVHVARRRNRAVSAAALARRRPWDRDHPLPRRSGGDRGDRSRPQRVRPLGPWRPRGVDVRLAGGRRPRERSARRHRP